jgi:Protein of unknown function (DUF3768)
VLNDNFRRTFVSGRVLMTAGVAALAEETKAELIRAIQVFDKFTKDNDPHGEHDFGDLEIAGQTYFWKIDYYAQDLRSGAEGAALPDTNRVLTIMRADEY